MVKQSKEASDHLAPKQKRSLESQQRLLEALHECLQTKFFEHISIKELADKAGLSVGTFYRRFKDKESLLPLLYANFGVELNEWAEHMHNNTYVSLDDALEQLCGETLKFFVSKKSIFRTLHLNARLHSSLLDKGTAENRAEVYDKLSDMILAFDSQVNVANKKKAADLVIFIMINALMEKVLYPDLTPAIACQYSAEELAKELPTMLKGYLAN